MLLRLTINGRYEPFRGVKFTTYATHCILGEIKRYFRDKSWLLKVPRSLKELNSIVHDTIECLTTRLGRSPEISEIAQELDVPSEIVMEVMEAGRSYNPCSLDDGDNFCFSDALCQTDKELRNTVDRIDLKEAIGTLNKREQMILHLFYFESRSQTKIAERLGISQMHVSRLLRQAIKNLSRLMTR
jgi:RNA polymerase sigma-B factor